MEPENESPIPSHDPRKTVKVFAIAMALLVILVIGIALNLNNTKTKKQDPQSQVQQASAQVEITKDGFVPATLSITKGTTVTWTNKDSSVHRVASNPHPEHTGLQGLDSQDVIGIESGTYSYTFNTPGEYTYHDHLNPTTNGTVVVQ
ncbi:MAG: cupredoxin domain-containing protein [Patescibacteria group bacterium]